MAVGSTCRTPCPFCRRRSKGTRPTSSRSSAEDVAHRCCLPFPTSSRGDASRVHRGRDLAERLGPSGLSLSNGRLKRFSTKQKGRGSHLLSSPVSITGGGTAFGPSPLLAGERSSQLQVPKVNSGNP